jgi:DNA-binding response OmpR family regulator
VNVLVVNPDEDFLQAVRSLLERDGYVAHMAQDITSALQLMEANRPDLVIMERDYLELEGRSFFAKLRQQDEAPVIFLTSSPSTTRDYSTMPLLSPYGLERIEAIMAHVRKALSNQAGGIIRIGELVIDTAKKRVIFRQRQVTLPPIQFRLLTYLALNQGRVVGYRELFQEVWGCDGEEDEARELLKVHIRQIRLKLGLDVQKAEYLQTVRGFGYMLAEHESQE